MNNEYYSQDNHGPYETYNLGDFELAMGGVIRDCKLAYSTFGKLNKAKDNAILLPTWYSGTSKIMEQVYIGRGRAIDPEKHFIIIVNQLGNGLSSSPSNTSPPFDMARFPPVSIEDDVRAQYELLTKKFGIDTLALVCGGSMGAQQTYQWCIDYPEMVRRAAPIAGTARVTPHNYYYTEILNQAIRSDPAWNNGWYTEPHAAHVGLRRQARIWAVMGFSTELYKQERWRELGFASPEDFVVGFLEGYFLPMDPNNLLCMTRKWQSGDVSKRANNNLKDALQRIKAKLFVIAIDEDMFFPVRDCQSEQEMIPGSELRLVNSLFGHLALFGLEKEYYEQIDTHLGDLLSIQI